MAASYERAAVEWSRGLQCCGRARPLLGEGAEVLPIVLCAALAWLLLQLLAVPLGRAVAPQFVQSVRDTAWSKARSKSHALAGDPAEEMLAAERAALADVGVRAAALAFSCYACFGSARLLLVPPESFGADPLFASDPVAQYYCAVAAGYFVWDVPVCIWYGYGPAFVVHAVTMLLVEFTALHPFYQSIMTTAHLFELSTPFLNFRQFCIASGRTDSRLFLASNVAFSLTFFFVRIVYGYPISFQFVYRVVSDLGGGSSQILERKGVLFVPAAWFSVCMCCALCVLNGFWFSQIVQSVLRHARDAGADGAAAAGASRAKLSRPSGASCAEVPEGIEMQSFSVRDDG